MGGYGGAAGCVAAFFFDGVLSALVLDLLALKFEGRAGIS